jgi:hypothetical protein
MNNETEENEDDGIMSTIIPSEEVEEEMEADDEGSYIEKGLVPPKQRSNGRNVDPRQQIAWDFYIKSFRSGKPNIVQSGIAAGYSKNTALNMGNFKWFKERKKRLLRASMFSKAERNLGRMLNLSYSKMKLREDGSEEEEIDKDVLRVVADISKTIVTTLGKDEGYSTKQEIGGKMESEIKINSISYADPIEIENKVVEDNQNLIENQILQNVRDNTTVQIQSEELPNTNS